MYNYYYHMHGILLFEGLTESFLPNYSLASISFARADTPGSGSTVYLSHLEWCLPSEKQVNFH